LVGVLVVPRERHLVEVIKVKRLDREEVSLLDLKADKPSFTNLFPNVVSKINLIRQKC
jgi:hypothetical protein